MMNAEQARLYRAKHREKISQQRRDKYASMTPEQRRLHIHRNPQREREYNLRRYYGMSVERFNAMFVAQDGRCAACSNPMIGSDACVDHSHETGRVRGLLCKKCNSAAGFLDDSADKARGLADYLTMA